MPSNQDISKLLFLLSSNDINVKIEAINELAKSSNIDAYEPLKNLLKQRNAPLKSHIKQALTSIENDIKSKNADLYEKLVNKEERESKSGALNYEVLEKYLDDDEIKNRIGVVSACGKYGRDKKIETLLIDRLAKEEHPFVIATLVINIGRCGSPETRDVIADFLKHDDERVRANSIEGLESLDDSSIIPLLLPLINDESPRVRANVAKALCKFEPELVKTNIINMLESGDENLAESARFALEAMKLKLREERPLDMPKPPSRNETRPEQPEEPFTDLETAASFSSRFLKFSIYSILLITLCAIAFLYSQPATKSNDGNETASSSPDYNAYEVRLIEKFDKALAEFETLLAAKKSSDARFALVKMKQIKPAEPVLKILEGEICMCENNYREAVSVFKTANKSAGDNPRLYYDIGLCYQNLGNTAEATNFFNLAIKFDKSAAFGKRAEKAIKDINDRAVKEAAAAKDQAVKFLTAYYSILNAEGPKSLRQYYNNKSEYDKFEKLWRLTLLDTKQWLIEYVLLNVDVKAGGERGKMVSAKVLESWHYTNFGGFSWILYFYREISLVETPEKYEFESGSTPLPILLNSAENITIADDKAADYEKPYKSCIKIAEAQHKDAADATATVEILKGVLKAEPGNVIAAMELASRRGAGTDEIFAMYNNIVKLDPASYPFRFAFGNDLIKASFTDIAANIRLAAGNEEEFLKMLKAAAGFCPKYAQAYLEMALNYNNKKMNADFEYAFKKALEIEPEYPALESFFYSSAYAKNLDLMKYSEIKMDVELINEIERLITLKPDYWRTYYNIGKIFLVLNKFEAAENFFKKSLELSPANCNVLARLSFCYHKMKKPEKALQFNEMAEKACQYNFQVKRNKKLLVK